MSASAFQRAEVLLLASEDTSFHPHQSPIAARKAGEYVSFHATVALATFQGFLRKKGNNCQGIL